MIEYNLTIKDSNTSVSKKDTLYANVLNEEALAIFRGLREELEKRFEAERGDTEDTPDKILKIKIVL